MNMKIKIITTIIMAMLLAGNICAQKGVVITDDENKNEPHKSALLDLKSVTKGMLIPRVTLEQREAINEPAEGLLVYQTDDKAGFYYFSKDGKWELIGLNDENSLTAEQKAKLLNDNDADPENEIELPAQKNNAGKFLTTDGTITKWETVQGFSGSYNDLTDVPKGLSDGDDNTQLSESEVDAFVANNGYLTQELDGSVTNELQTLTVDIENNKLSISEKNSVGIDTDPANEIQSLTISANKLKITNGNQVEYLPDYSTNTNKILKVNTDGVLTWADDSDNQLTNNEVVKIIDESEVITKKITTAVNTGLVDINTKVADLSEAISGNPEEGEPSLPEQVDALADAIGIPEDGGGGVSITDQIAALAGATGIDPSAPAPGTMPLPVQVATIAEDVGTLEEGAPSLADQISDVNTKVDDLQDVVSANEKNIKDTEDKLEDKIEKSIDDLSLGIESDNLVLKTKGETTPLSSIALSSFSGDNDAQNEIQKLSKSGSRIYLSNGGGSVSIPGSTNTDKQTLSFNTTSNALTITNGNSVDLSSLVNGGLPTQTGNNGKILTTDGTNASWTDDATTVDLSGLAEIPDQTGNNGKYLTTDGATASWANVTGSLPAQAGNAGKILTTDGTNASWTPEQELSYDPATYELSISNGTTPVDLSSLAGVGLSEVSAYTTAIPPQDVTGGAYIAFDFIAADLNSELSLDGTTFTAGSDGLFMINALITVEVDPGGATGVYKIIIEKTGAAEKTVVFYEGTGNYFMNSLQVSDCIYLNAGDEIKIKFEEPGIAGTAILSGNSEENRLTIVQLR